MALLNLCGFRLAAPIVALTFAAASVAQTADEYDIKAAFLFNFTRFVAWPANSAGSPFCIGILGSDPFHGALEDVANGRTAGGRAIVVRRLKTGQDAGACEMVFISGSDLNRARAGLASMHGLSVLTVGEAPGFCHSGGVIELDLRDSKVKLEINIAAAQRAHLQISSKLLSLATVVRDSGI